MFPAPRLGTSLFLLLGAIVACGMAFPVMEVKSVDHQKDEISHFQNAEPIGPDFGLDQEKGLPRKTLEETISEVIEEESKFFPKPKKGRNIYRTLKGYNRKRTDRNKGVRKSRGIFYKWKDHQN